MRIRSLEVNQLRRFYHWSHGCATSYGGSMSAEFPPFRPGNVLATAFTGTLSERHGEPVERLPTPGRLLDWCAWRGLEVSSCSEDELAQAKLLRESIHLVATAASVGEPLPQESLLTVNECSAGGRSAAVLTSQGELQWRLYDGAVSDALSVIARDAISVIAGERDGRLALCASPTCQAAFLDTSRSRTRRWCDMNTCGNREKKARLKAKNT